MKYKIGIVVDGLGINDWVEATVLAAKWYAEVHNLELLIDAPKKIDPKMQMSVIRKMIDREPDALIIQPIQGAAVNPALMFAREKGIPVITEDMLVRTSSPLLDIRFDNYNAGVSAGNSMLKIFNNMFGEIPEGNIVIIVSKKNPHQMERSNGCISVLEKIPEINLIELDITPCAEMTDNARDGISKILKEKKIMGCFGYGNLVTLGIAQAIDENKLFRTKISKEHIAVTGIDACPKIIDLMMKGKVDLVIDQPCSFYIPIGLYYAQKYLEEGESSLPKAGETISEDDIIIKGADPYKVNPWKVQSWSPAEVDSIYEHLWFKTNSIEVTPDNCAEPWLWGNFIRKSL